MSTSPRKLDFPSRLEGEVLDSVCRNLEDVASQLYKLNFSSDNLDKAMAIAGAIRAGLHDAGRGVAHCDCGRG